MAGAAAATFAPAFPIVAGLQKNRMHQSDMDVLLISTRLLCDIVFLSSRIITVMIDWKGLFPLNFHKETCFL